MGMPFVVVLEVLFIAIVRTTHRTFHPSAKDGIKVLAKGFVINLKWPWTGPFRQFHAPFQWHDKILLDHCTWQTSPE